VRRTGRRPGVEGLIESHRSTGHRIAIHVQEAEHDLGGRAGDAERLRRPGDGSEPGVFRTCAEGGESNALGGPVEAGLNGGSLAFSEWADRERVGGDARCVGDGRGVSLSADPGSAGLPGYGLATFGDPVGEDLRLHGPREGGAGG
jgi:hypothetical protein